MGNPNDIEDLFGDSISSESESSPNDDEFCDNEDSESSYVGISMDELLNSLKRKLSKKKNTDEGTSNKNPMKSAATLDTKLTRFSIGSNDVKENVPVKPIERSFLDMLDSSIDVNLNEDDKSKFNDDSSMVKDQNTCNDNAIGNEKTPMKISSSPKDKIAVVDGIMKKLSKPAISSIVGFNERKSIFLGHEKPSFKIWDSDDDFPNEKKHLKTQIIPKDLSQDFDDNSQSQLKNSTNEDKLVMITLEDTDTEILTQHNEKENLNIEQLQKKINTFVVKPDKKLKMSTGSPERILLCNVDKSVGQCSTSQKPKHDLRRILQPARYYTDPYSPERHSFPVTQYDRQVYNAVCKISKSNFQDKVAVDIDGVHCKFYTFGDSFKPSGELSNFVACVFCRYMFRSCHPSKSKKHYFFSSIGDDLLKDRSMTNFSAVKKCFDGASLARPVHTCDLDIESEN
ncbi:Os01g0861200 [Oryza sativa Japonica Group]|uniref:Os01g0861200 protein n=1 Tax=Oryza sativa subsp. japonica TaxID=39947 RepID=A0A0P0VAQ4_ORYSJ|nr:Os01g0861200 [Oryza sativa Japonica Group]